ncbi:MAG: hypothetical protein Pars2KO_24950 [Parasphingorhabdus sp.]
MKTMLVNPIGHLKRKCNISTLLIEQLQELLGSEYCIVLRKERPWASITFSGVRYLFEIVPTNSGGDSFSNRRFEQLTEHEFELPGQFVADILVRGNDGGTPTPKIEILAIADPVSD